MIPDAICYVRKGQTFPDLGDHINKYVYPLQNIPDYYGPRYDYELDALGGGPIKLPLNGECGQGLYTIAWMIDAYFNETPFEFVRTEDIVHVAVKLQQYIAAMQKYPLSDEEKRYMTRATNLYNVLEKNARIVINKYGKQSVCDALTGKTFLKELAYGSR